MTSGNRSFNDVVDALDHIAFIENRNAVFIWSVEMCFIFVAQINVIFTIPLYEAVILSDCIINREIWLLLRQTYIAPFLDLLLSISNGFVSSKIYDKHDD